MNNFIKAEMLSERLESSPQYFFESGAWYSLLEEYFEGYPVETLRRWLISDDYYICKSALCIASELGNDACALVEDVLPYFFSNDPELIYYALDIVVVCSHLYPKTLVHILSTMDSSHDFLRRRAMYLMSRKRPKNLLPALRLLQAQNPKDAHIDGLSKLVNAGQVPVETVQTMIIGHNPLLRRYGALIAFQKIDSSFNLMELVENSDDPDLRYFASDVR